MAAQTSFMLRQMGVFYCVKYSFNQQFPIFKIVLLFKYFMYQISPEQNNILMKICERV
jgi:hypothetical protein